MRPGFLLFLLTSVCYFPAIAAPPEAPTGLEASDNAFTNRIALSWEHVQGAQIYRVFRSPVDDPATAASIGITESLTFTDFALPNEAFFYWVRAEGTNGASPLSKSDRGHAGTTGGSFILTGIRTPGQAPTIPSTNPVTAAKIYLGKTLFWDEQLSSTKTVACGTCHRFRSGVTDPRSSSDAFASIHPGFDRVFGTADDIAGSQGVPRTLADGSYTWDPIFGLRPQVTERRASSILDAAGAIAGVLWDGKPGFTFNDPETGQNVFNVGAALEAQALLPLLNPVEMGHQGRTAGDVIARIRQSRPLALASSVPSALSRWISNRTYADLFNEAFGTPDITPARIVMALATYERSLVPDRSPLDGTSPGFIRGFQAFNQGGCTICHRTTPTGDDGFRVTGVRPPQEDTGRGKVTGQPVDMGAFRPPSIRNAGLRAGFQHTGRFASIEEVVEFYNRGGDFKESVGFSSVFVRPLNFTPQQKADLAAFLRYATLDQRVARESAPLFDRPLLYSESARVPAITGVGIAAGNGAIPEIVALEPPFAGNPSFTIALANVPPGVQAVLAIDREDPGTGAVPENASFLRRQITTSGDNAGHGFASFTAAIPADLAGTTLYARWYVTNAGQLSVSKAARFTVFLAEPVTETFTSISAASLTKGAVARESIVSGFGLNLATATTVAPSGALPTTLGGIKVTITDRAGATFDAPLFFVAESQINYLVPSNAAEGEAVIRVTRDNAVIATGRLHIAAVAPGLFAANSDGRDTASALAQRISGGASTTTGVIRFDNELQRFVPQPIDLGPESEDTFLLLFGTGLRGHGDGPVTATIGGVPADVLFAGAQGQFDGLDQVNLRIPRSLAGRGEVDVVLWVDGKRANTVRISVQ